MIAANATGASKNRIVKASRMPQEHHKIIIRPHRGLNLSKGSTTAIGTAVIEASGLRAEQASEDVVCPNFKQNIVVISTPEPAHHSDVCPTPDSVQCRGCGALNPPENHICTPTCKFCGGRHPPETKHAGSGFKYPMWYGPAKENATVRDWPRRCLWRRQAYKRAPKTTHAHGDARDPDAARYTGRTVHSKSRGVSDSSEAWSAWCHADNWDHLDR
ncbi:hypothetical protein HPB51_011311 [Rhipicephalus microplus]|uniref:Uncharacterized protein n=1 Tax=Rhipicephalus microplus TaxID=6941 RepID=A0A9J6DLX7_RHIMP|nr:hypothetical protein HPB51_011311 [Rhipicephalus microplus]